MSKLERAQGDCSQCKIAVVFEEGEFKGDDISACEICQADGRPQQRKQALIIHGMDEESDRLKVEARTTATFFVGLLGDS